MPDSNWIQSLLGERRVYDLGQPLFAGMPGHPSHPPFIFSRNGIHILEMVNLEELARDRQYTFLFVVSPLKIVGGTGSPVRPLAIV